LYYFGSLVPALHKTLSGGCYPPRRCSFNPAGSFFFFFFLHLISLQEMEGSAALEKLRNDKGVESTNEFLRLTIRISKEVCAAENESCPGLLVSGEGKGRPHKNDKNIKVRCAHWKDGCTVLALIYLLFFLFFFF
jgi:hypothetical protein